MSSILDCLRPKIPAKIYDDVALQYDNILRAAGGDTGLADARFLEWLPQYRDGFVRSRLNHALASKRVEDMIQVQLDILQAEWDGFKRFKGAAQWLARHNRGEPTRVNAIERVYQLADLEAQRGAKELLSQLTELYDQVTPKGLMLDADRSIMRDVVTGLIDGIDALSNADTRAAAKQLRDVMDAGLKAYRDAGGLIGEIKNYTPIKHNAVKIRQAGFDEWYAAYREMTNISKVVDYQTGKLVSEKRFKEIAKDMYSDITTDGATRAERELGRSQKTLRYKNVDMFSRRMQARLSSPQNAASFLKYNDLYGMGDEGMYDLIVSNLESIGRDTGVMRALGAMPAAINDHLTKTVVATGGGTKGKKKTDALFRTLIGSWEGSVDNMLSRGATNVHNLMSSSLLGSASLPALGDRVFYKHAKRLHGLIGTSDINTFLQTLSTNPDDLVRAMHVYEALSHTSVNRFDGDMGMTPTGRMMIGLNNLKNFNHRISGLQQLTLASADTLTMSFFGDLGGYVQKATSFADLPADFRTLLMRHNLDEGDWGRLIANGVDPDDLFITPDKLPDNMSSIAGKLDVINLQLRLWATNSPDLRQRMWTTGNRLGPQVRGDIGHLLSSLIFQFKSFPMVVFRNHFMPSLTRAVGNDATPFMNMMMGSLFYGTLIVQAKELLKGNPMYNPEDPKESAELLMRALVQSGGAGLIGDSLFKDPDAYGRNLLAELAGPGLRATTDLGLQTLSAFKYMAWADDDENMNWAAVTSAGKPFVPLATLWYLRASFDRMLMDSLNAALDDDFYTNALATQKEHMNERGGTGWWAKGDFLPEGLQ